MKTGGKILVCILCLVIIGLVGYIVWDKCFKDNKFEEKTNVVSNTVTTSKTTTPDKLMVNREGMKEEVASKEFSSSYGYTIRYATEQFKAETHDEKDWFVHDGDTNCVVVSKENVTYSNKVASFRQLVTALE